MRRRRSPSPACRSRSIDVNSQEGRAYELSFSAGVAMFDPEEPLTLDQLIGLADERMYACKRAKQARSRTTTAAIA